MQGGGRRFESDLLHQSTSVLAGAPRRPGEVLRDLEMLFDNSIGFSKAEHASVSGLCVVKLLRVNGGCLGVERR